MSTELSVSIKGEDKTYKQQFLVYEEMSWSEEDPTIKGCIDEALSNAKIVPEKIQVRGLLVIK